MQNTLRFLFVLGLILVPNGKLIGKKLGDQYPREDELERLEKNLTGPGGRRSALFANYSTIQSNSVELEREEQHRSHPWGVFFTVVGTVLLDFDADACQSPSRAYLLGVTLPGKWYMIFMTDILPITPYIMLLRNSSKINILKSFVNVLQ